MDRNFARRGARWLAIGASGLALAVLSASPAGAATTTFGADLVGPADNTPTCATVNWYPAGGQPSCTFYSSAPGPSFYAPASATVTTVRVKTGPSTGPMQVVVMYSLYQNNVSDPGHPYYACCWVAQYGPTFTPAATAVTPIATSLSMVEQPTPPPNDGTTNAEGDFLAISVLNSSTPIPATSDSNSFFTGFAPAPNPSSAPPRGPNPPPVSATTGGTTAHIAMNADLNTGDGGGGGGGGGGPGTPPPTFPPPGIPGAPTGALRPVTINPTGGQLFGNTGLIPLTCALSTACNGALTLGPFRAGAAAKSKPRKAKTYGSAQFSIPAGHTTAVRVTLNASGRKALRGHKSLKVTATAKVGTKDVTATLTLKRAAKHGRKT
jgi:hypothetical protein